MFWQFRRVMKLWLNRPTLMNRLRRSSADRKSKERELAKRIRASDLRARYRTSRPGKSDLPPYLARNRWEEELNYKLWITKGARFAAARRCEEKEHAATWTNALLSCYLIIIGLIPLVPNPPLGGFSSESAGLWTAGVSILLLAYGLIVATQKYSVQSISYHDCALRIGVLYNALRRAKEFDDEVMKVEEIKRISLDYDELLKHFPNHHRIDSEIFEVSKWKYFKLTRRNRFSRHFRYWVQTKAVHHLTLIIPLLLLFWWVFTNSRTISG